MTQNHKGPPRERLRQLVRQGAGAVPLPLGGSLQPLAIQTMFPGLVLLLLAGIAGATNVTAPGGPVIFAGSVPVFYQGLNGSKCYRIPSIIKTSRGTLLAFSENRVTDCGDNGPHHALVLRRSTDNGQTWGPMSTVVEGTTPCPGCPAAISNPNPVEVTLPSGKKAVLMSYDTMNNPSTKRHGLDMLIWSHDDGLTWTDKALLSFPPEKNLGGLIGPSVGIQASDGSIYFSVIDTAGSGHFLFFSKDYGKTWRASTPVPGLGECSIAFLVSPSDGRIIMNCRIGAGNRAQVIWSKDAVPGAITHPAELNVDPGCQGSIINQGGTLYTSNANSTHSRSHMAIKISKDQVSERCGCPHE